MKKETFWKNPIDLFNVYVFIEELASISLSLFLSRARPIARNTHTKPKVTIKRTQGNVIGIVNGVCFFIDTDFFFLVSLPFKSHKYKASQAIDTVIQSISIDLEELLNKSLFPYQWTCECCHAPIKTSKSIHWKGKLWISALSQTVKNWRNERA